MMCTVFQAPRDTTALCTKRPSDLPVRRLPYMPHPHARALMAATVHHAAVATASSSRVNNSTAAGRSHRWPGRHHHRHRRDLPRRRLSPNTGTPSTADDRSSRRGEGEFAASAIVNASSATDVTEGLTVTTFNVLAPCYRRIKQADGEVKMEATFPELALERQTRVLDILSDLSSSIVCLQEFWHASPEISQLYLRELSQAGYATYVTPRTSNRPDGLLTAVKKEDFDVMEHRDILFNDCGDRVATLLHLRHKGGGGGGGKSSSSLGDVLVVNTHLLFPHNSNSTLIRLRESFKILEYLHEYQEKMAGEVARRGGGKQKTKRLPVVMCGDFNGTIRGSVSRFLQSQGFMSAFEVFNANCGCDGDEDNDAISRKQLSMSKWISHLNHHGKVVGVDHVWVLNPSKQYANEGNGVLPPSWKAAIYAMIQAKMLEKGLMDNDEAFAFFDIDSDLGITRDEFEMAVQMLDLTGEGTPGLVSSEIQTLYDDCDLDKDGLVDFGEFVQNFDIESMDRAYRAVCNSQNIEEGPWDVVGDLMTASASPTVLAGFTIDDTDDDEEEEEEEVLDASVSMDDDMGGGEERGAGTTISSATLVGRTVVRGDLVVKSAALPAAMEAGEWPEDFDVSDHGPLTAVLVSRKKANASG